MYFSVNTECYDSLLKDGLHLEREGEAGGAEGCRGGVASECNKTFMRLTLDAIVDGISLCTCNDTVKRLTLNALVYLHV